MALVGNFTVYTYATVAGKKSSSIASGSKQPKHVIEIRNCSTLDYTVAVSGQIIGNPPKVMYSGGRTKWTSPLLTLLRLKRAYPDEPLIHTGPAGREDLACMELDEKSVYSSSSTVHSNIGVTATIDVI